MPPNIQNVLHHKHASFLTLPSLQHVDSWHFHSTNPIPVELVRSVLQHCDTSEQVSATHSVTKIFHDYLPHEICFYFFCRMCKILIYELTSVMGSPIIMVAIPDPSLMQHTESSLHGVSQHCVSFEQAAVTPKKLYVSIRIPSSV